MNQHKPYINTAIFPLLAIFLLIILLLIGGTTMLQKWGLQNSKSILHSANIFWLLLSFVTLFMQQKALTNSNPNIFVRAVMGSMLIKMIAGAMAVLIYYSLSGDLFNQKAVVGFLLMYIIYLGAEVRIMMKLNQKNHG